MRGCHRLAALHMTGGRALRVTGWALAVEVEWDALSVCVCVRVCVCGCLGAVPFAGLPLAEC